MSYKVVGNELRTIRVVSDPRASTIRESLLSLEYKGQGEQAVRMALWRGLPTGDRVLSRGIQQTHRKLAGGPFVILVAGEYSHPPNPTWT